MLQNIILMPLLRHLCHHLRAVCHCTFYQLRRWDLEDGEGGVWWQEKWFTWVQRIPKGDRNYLGCTLRWRQWIWRSKGKADDFMVAFSIKLNDISDSDGGSQSEKRAQRKKKQDAFFILRYTFTCVDLWNCKPYFLTRWWPSVWRESRTKTRGSS